jgi:uncharacterized protein (TIGR02186 family)
VRIALLLLMAAMLGGAAPKPKLVPDVSQRRIDIIYSFTGAELLLFGAIIYPDGRVPARPADVVVVIKGPTESILLREKQKIAGMWMNAESARFRSVPSYYAVASSRPLDRIVDPRTAAIYEFGLGNIQLSPASSALPDVQKRFEQGLVDLKRRNGLYVEAPGGVEVSEGVLYRARISLPARVPVGNYTAETFLVQDGRVVAAAVRTIAIDRTGFERTVAAFAQSSALAYGLIAVALSVLLGWLAGVAFRRK